MRELLDDLSDGFFMKAIRNMAQGFKEVYPNTNLIAHIRDRADEIKKAQPPPVPVLELPMSEEERERNRKVAKKYISELGKKLWMK